MNLVRYVFCKKKKRVCPEHTTCSDLSNKEKSPGTMFILIENRIDIGMAFTGVILKFTSTAFYDLMYNGSQRLQKFFRKRGFCHQVQNYSLAFTAYSCCSSPLRTHLIILHPFVYSAKFNK